MVQGQSALDQAPITGESMPVDKEPGSDVFAGSINGHGALEVRVTRHAEDTTLAQILHAVEEAQASRAPSQIVRGPVRARSTRLRSASWPRWSP